MKKKVWILAPIVALLVGAICFFAGSLKDVSRAVNGDRVDIEGGAKFTLSSGKISSSSRSVDNGGGVSVTNGTFIMSGGSIESNKATNGGGVYVASSGTFTMNSGTISSNSATNGGGVYVAGTFTMGGGEIGSNTATNGAGIYISGGTFNYNGGKIVGEIYTNTTLNINSRPSSVFNIHYDGIAIGTQIAKIPSGVAVSLSDYNVSNMPADSELAKVSSSGYNYIVVAQKSYRDKLQTINFVVPDNEMGGVGVDKTSITIPAKDPNNVFEFVYFDVDGQTLNVMKYSVDMNGNRRDELIDSVNAITGSSRESWFLGWFWGKHENGKIPNPTLTYDGLQYVRIENDYQKGEFPRSVTAGWLITYEEQPTIYARFSQRLSGNVYIRFNDDNAAEVVGNTVKKIGTGYYSASIPSEAYLYNKQGMFMFATSNPLQDVYFEIVPKLGYYISTFDTSGFNFSPSGETIIDTHSTNLSGLRINCVLSDLSSSGQKMTIAYYNRSEMTRQEMCIAYMLYYSSFVTGTSSVSSEYGSYEKVGRPVYDFEYYDDYTDSELRTFLNKVTTMTRVSSLSYPRQYDMTIGDEIVGSIDYPYNSNYMSRLLGSYNYVGGYSRFIPTSYDVEAHVKGESDLSNYYVFWNKNLEWRDTEEDCDRHFLKSGTYYKNYKLNSRTGVYVECPGLQSNFDFVGFLNNFQSEYKSNVINKYYSGTSVNYVYDSVNQKTLLDDLSLLDDPPFIIVDSAVFSSEYIKYYNTGLFVKGFVEYLLDFIGYDSTGFGEEKGTRNQVESFWDVVQRDLTLIKYNGNSYDSMQDNVSKFLYDGIIPSYTKSGSFAATTGAFAKGVFFGIGSGLKFREYFINELLRGWGYQDFRSNVFDTDCQLGHNRSYYDFLIAENNDAINFLASNSVRQGTHWTDSGTTHQALAEDNDAPHTTQIEKQPNNPFFDNKKFYLVPIRVATRLRAAD